MLLDYMLNTAFEFNRILTTAPVMCTLSTPWHSQMYCASLTAQSADAQQMGHCRQQPLLYVENHTGLLVPGNMPSD
jgi:hypothetical protein